MLELADMLEEFDLEKMEQTFLFLGAAADVSFEITEKCWSSQQFLRCTQIAFSCFVVMEYLHAGRLKIFEWS